MLTRIKQTCKFAVSSLLFQILTCCCAVFVWRSNLKRHKSASGPFHPVHVDGIQLGQYDELPLCTLIEPPKPSNDEGRVYSVLILSNPSLYDALFDECSPSTLIKISQTCRLANRSVEDYIGRAFDVNRLLSRYFSDPLSFRRLQASTATIIGGSAALQLFSRTFWDDTGLDLFVPRVWGREVGEFLLRSGYSFIPCPPQHPTFGAAFSDKEVAEASVTSSPCFKGTTGSFDFATSTSDCRTAKVRMIVVARSPIEVILRSHSSMPYLLFIWAAVVPLMMTFLQPVS